MISKTWYWDQGWIFQYLPVGFDRTWIQCNLDTYIVWGKAGRRLEMSLNSVGAPGFEWAVRFPIPHYVVTFKSVGESD